MDKNNNLLKFILFIYFIVIGYIIYNNYVRDLYNNDIFSSLDYNINNNKYIINRNDDDEFKNIVIDIQSKINYYYPNIILITSKIIVTDNSFSYTANRSTYSCETRFNQTIDTITSIRTYIPNACIFLIDNSNFDEKYIYMHNKLNEMCDFFINPNNNTELDYYTNINKYKSIAEGYQIMYFLDIFNQLNIKYDRFFKITGRYYLNNSFNFNNYLSNDIIFSNDLSLNYIYYYTCFYMISYDKFNMYVNAYKIIYLNINNIDFIQNDIEYNLPQLIKLENIKLIPELGVTQRISVSGQVSNI
jgi:hypothetical protein